jgi:hypothetical protein
MRFLWDWKEKGIWGPRNLPPPLLYDFLPLDLIVYQNSLGIRWDSRVLRKSLFLSPCSIVFYLHTRKVIVSFLDDCKAGCDLSSVLCLSDSATQAGRTTISDYTTEEKRTTKPNKKKKKKRKKRGKKKKMKTNKEEKATRKKKKKKKE